MLLHKTLHFMQRFVQKIKQYHAAAGKTGRSYRHMPDLNAHRITRVIYTSYAVTDPKAYCASGRAEDSMLLHKTLHEVQRFVQKKKAYHAVAGKSGHSYRHMPDLNARRITRVIYTTSALPLAKLRFVSSNGTFARLPRNAYY